VDTWGEIK